jgi:hypothetical protein
MSESASSSGCGYEDEFWQWPARLWGGRAGAPAPMVSHRVAPFEEAEKIRILNAEAQCDRFWAGTVRGYRLIARKAASDPAGARLRVALRDQRRGFPCLTPRPLDLAA